MFIKKKIIILLIFVFFFMFKIDTELNAQALNLSDTSDNSNLIPILYKNKDNYNKVCYGTAIEEQIIVSSSMCFITTSIQNKKFYVYVDNKYIFVKNIKYNNDFIKNIPNTNLVFFELSEKIISKNKIFKIWQDINSINTSSELLINGYKKEKTNNDKMISFEIKTMFKEYINIPHLQNLILAIPDLNKDLIIKDSELFLYLKYEDNLFLLGVPFDWAETLNLQNYDYDLDNKKEFIFTYIGNYMKEEIEDDKEWFNVYSITRQIALNLSLVKLVNTNSFILHSQKFSKNMKNMKFLKENMLNSDSFTHNGYIKNDIELIDLVNANNSYLNITYIDNSLTSLYSLTLLMPNLKNLSLANEKIIDYSELKKLKQLQNLTIELLDYTATNYLYNIPNNINFDISNSHLETLTLNKINSTYLEQIKWEDMLNLKELIIINSQISSFDFLKNIPKLSSLQLKNISLTNDFTMNEHSYNIQKLKITGEINNYNLFIWKNFSKLTDLTINSANINNIDFLKNIPNLILINLADNNISNFTILKSLSFLQNIDIRFNTQASFACPNNVNCQISNIPKDSIYNICLLVKNLTNYDKQYYSIFQEFFYIYEQIHNVSEHYELFSNKHCQIIENKFKNEIKNLNIKQYFITSLNIISQLKNLEQLNINIENNVILNLAQIEQLTKLKNLEIIGFHKNINIIEKLPRLTKLNLFADNFNDFSNLKSKTLTELTIESKNNKYNTISTLNDLKYLPNLKNLKINNNNINNLLPLLNNTYKLKTLDISNNNIQTLNNIEHFVGLKIKALNNEKLNHLTYCPFVLGSCTFNSGIYEGKTVKHNHFLKNFENERAINDNYLYIPGLGKKYKFINK